MKIKQAVNTAVLAALATVVILAGCHHGGAEGMVAWPEYVGFHGEDGALSFGETAGKYLDAIKGRANGDPSIDPALKTSIKNRCDELQDKRFSFHTLDETYLIIAVAERHSAAARWNEVWTRLGGTTQTDPAWSASYKPTSSKLSDYDKNVQTLLDAIKAKFPQNATIIHHCGERLKTPHSGMNRNTSWARIVLTYEFAINKKPGLVGQELDHPEGKTK